MSHADKIKDCDAFFVVDPITRQIINKTPAKIVIMQGDHNSERFTFSLPRYIEGHDMAESAKAKLHYKNAAKADIEGMYEMKDLQIDTEDSEKVKCSWLISGNATKEAGQLAFLIVFECYDGDVLVYSWHTQTHKGISVGETFDNAEEIATKYADVLEQWEQRLFDANSQTVKDVEAARDEALAQIYAARNFANEIRNTATGEAIKLTDSADAKIHSLNVYGKTTQAATPTPDNPQELESVGETVDISVYEKNLFNNDTSLLKEITYGTQSPRIGYECSYLIGNYVITAIDIDPSIEKYIYGLIIDKNGNSKKSFHLLEWTRNLTPLTVTLDVGDKLIIHDGSGNSLSHSTKRFEGTKIQVEAGDVATPYEPYKEPQTFIVNAPNGLKGIPVTSGGNYTDSNGKQWITDEIDLERGMYVQRIGESTVTFKSTNVLASGNRYGVCIVSDKIKKNMVGGISEKTTFVARTSSQIENTFYENGENFVFVGSIDDTEESLKANFEGSKLQYVLAEPIETPLSAEEIEAYKALHTNYPNTTIYNNEGAHTEVTYVADTKNYIDNKFAELQQAIISTGGNV